MKTKTFFSEFSNSDNKDIAVGIIGKDDYRYEVLKPLFDKYGPGFTDTNIGCVFIDGEAGLSKAELKWIEAHEVAHIRLKHNMGDRDARDEYEADTFARLYLLKHDYTKAAQLISKHSIERHGKQI
jgi:hypothetical protein